MDYRMNNIGNRIIANSDYASLTKPIYPFFKPSITARQYDPPSSYFSYPFVPPHPVISPATYNNSYMHQTRHNLYNSLLKEKVQDLEDALKERQTMRKQATLAKVQSLSQLSVESHNGNTTESEMVKIINRQQDLIGDMVRSVENLQNKFNLPPNGLEYGYPIPRSTKQTPDTRLLDPPLDKQVFRKDLLKDLEIDSDHESEYLNKEKFYKFNSGLTEREKESIYNKIKSEKFSREKIENKKKVRGINKFRSVVFCILFPIFIYSIVNKRKGTLKKNYLKDMQEAINIFLEVAGTWVIKSTREPISSILNNSSLNFDIAGKDQWFSKGKPDALNTKMLKIHVRIRAVFEGLKNHTNPQSFPMPLMKFIDKFVNNGAFIPSRYFVHYEKARLEFDTFGALCNQTEDRKSMLICFFFITRIFIGKFLLHPRENSLPVKSNSKVLQ
jgi:hypothetical protein